jgi:hypothetical protein
MEYGFSIDTFHFSPLAADFAIKNNLNFDDFLDWLPPHNVRQFRQERMLKFGYWKAKEIAFLYECNSHSFSSMFFCPPDAVAAVIAVEESECDFDENTTTSRGNLPPPEDAPMHCGAGSIKDSQLPTPLPHETLPQIPEGICGGRGILPDPKKSGCGTGQQKEPKPKETCNWSQEQKFPSFGGGDEVEIEEDESEKPTDKTKPPTGSDAPSIEKPADGSIPKIKTIDEPSAEEIGRAHV